MTSHVMQRNDIAVCEQTLVANWILGSSNIVVNLCFYRCPDARIVHYYTSVLTDEINL